MTKFNTGNPVGSSDPRDLFDNAAVADSLVTGDAASYNDRLGKPRKSWQGMEDEFAAFIAAGGYVGTGTDGAVENYAAGIEITGYNQIVRDSSGEFWRLSGPVVLPYTTTGAGLPEGGAFVAVGDAALRQELKGSVLSGLGAKLVKGASIYVESVAEVEELSVSAGTVVYLTEEGKHGNFVFLSGDKSSQITNDPRQGVWIAPSFDPNGYSGAWMRRYKGLGGHLSALWFGAVGDGTTDDTAAIQAAINYTHGIGGGTVYLPAAMYRATKITRKTGVSLKGDGFYSTYIKALPYTEARPYGLIEIDQGPVTGSDMLGIHLLAGDSGPINPDQWGMYIHAQYDDTNTDGGLWLATHDQIRITYFNNGLWSRGGYSNTNFVRPNQFTDYNDVFIQVPDGGEALRLTGQHGQIRFFGGSADGRDGNTAQRAITLDYDPDPSTTAKEGVNGESASHTAGTNPAIQSPTNVTFGASFSVQKAEEGIFGRLCKNITLEGLWIENIGKFLTASTASQFSVDNCHLAKAANGAVFGAPGAGWLLSQGANAQVTWGAGSNITGTTDNFYDPSSNLNNTYYQKLELSTALSGKFKAAADKSQTMDGTGAVNIGGHKFALVQPNADRSVKLTEFTAAAAPGERVVIQPTAAPLTIAAGGNITLNTVAEITCPRFGVIELMRVFSIGASAVEWKVISVQDHYGTSEPSDGSYYAQGTRIWRSNPSGGSFMGWTCVTPGLAGSTAVFKTMPNLNV